MPVEYELSTAVENDATAVDNKRNHETRLNCIVKVGRRDVKEDNHSPGCQGDIPSIYTEKSALQAFYYPQGRVVIEIVDCKAQNDTPFLTLHSTLAFSYVGRELLF